MSEFSNEDLACNEAAARRTCVLIAGVEAYTAPLGELKGAVRAALKFHDWVKARGIPDGQIFLHVSPPESWTRPARWQDFVATTESLKEADADTLLVYWAGHGDRSKRNRRLYTEDSGALQQVADFNSLLDALSSGEMPFETVFAFVDACATRSAYKFNELKFVEDDLDPKAVQYAYFATSLGEEASYYDDGGLFSSVIFKWLEGVCLPLDPKRVDEALGARFRELEHRFQRPVSLWVNRSGKVQQTDVDDQIALQYSLAVEQQWEDRRNILLLSVQPGSIREDPSFLAPELDALTRQFAESAKPAAPNESARSVDPLEFLAKYKHAVLLGEPGSGKSTLLRSIQQRLLPTQKGSLPEGLQSQIPLFVDLSRWESHIKTLDDFLCTEAKRLGADEFAAEWPLLKEKRKFVIILDGLDKMPQRPPFNPEDEAKRLDQDHRIAEIRDAADPFLCILSCRPREFDGRPVWRDLHLLPLGENEMRRFAAM